MTAKPRTEAARTFAEEYPHLAKLIYGTTGQPILVAIEEQAATEARRELLAKVEGLPWHDPFTNALGGEVKVSRAVVGRAAVLRLIEESQS